MEYANFLTKKRRGGSTIDIEKDGGKNATERNNEGTPTGSRHNGRIKTGQKKDKNRTNKRKDAGWQPAQRENLNGGKNATEENNEGNNERNNPHTMRDNRRNGQTKRNGLKRGREVTGYGRGLEFFAEGGRRGAGVALEEGTEMGLVYEAKLVRYFLDGEGGGTKERLGTLGEGMLNTGTCGHSDSLFDRVGDIPGGEAELLGVPVEVVVSLAMLVHQLHETARDLFASGERGYILFGVGDVSCQKMEEGIDQEHRCRTVFGVDDFAEEFEIMDYALYFLRTHVPNGMYIDMGDEGKGELQIHLHHKLARDGHHIEFHVFGGRFQLSHKEIGNDQIAVVRLEVIALVVDRGSKSTFCNKLERVAWGEILGGQDFQEEVGRRAVKFHDSNVVHGGLSGNKTHPFEDREISQNSILIFLFFSHKRVNQIYGLEQFGCKGTTIF